ncbi:MAG: division/cell wall cluster transcriptional repressor MraZ [Myxococcales bacterium]|nr:division/cell wall cluster transcriptional repressor MraZ [Myxococcales bacterium]
MFRGRYEHTIDTKGRVSLPAKFREILSTHYDERLVVTTNFDHNLIAYPFPEWQKLEQKISGLSQLNPNVIKYKRLFISGACECSIDGNGRILLPPTLRDYAGLARDVVFAGMVNTIEIWAKDRWEKEFESARSDAHEVAAALADLGL